MSYSFSFQVREGDDAEAAFDKAVEDHNAANPQLITQEKADHFRAIRTAVGAVMFERALGAGTLVNVNVSGHAEPDHTKREGWSADQISLSFSQLQEEAPA